MTSKEAPAMGRPKAAQVTMEAPKVNVPMGTPAVREHEVMVVSTSSK